MIILLLLTTLTNSETFFSLFVIFSKTIQTFENIFYLSTVLNRFPQTIVVLFFFNTFYTHTHTHLLYSHLFHFFLSLFILFYFFAPLPFKPHKKRYNINKLISITITTSSLLFSSFFFQTERSIKNYRKEFIIKYIGIQKNVQFNKSQNHLI